MIFLVHPKACEILFYFDTFVFYTFKNYTFESVVVSTRAATPIVVSSCIFIPLYMFEDAGTYHFFSIRL